MQNSKLIYHYCSLRTAIEFILPDTQLLLNNVGNSNDPRENKSYNFAISSSPPSRVEFNIWEINTKITKEIRKGTKMTCFSTDDGMIKGYGHSRMWALYGDNHKGLCLEIDEEEFLKENAELIKKGHYDKIKYDNLNEIPSEIHSIDYNSLSPTKITKYLEQFKREKINFLFFRKNSEWESEKEKRLLLFSPQQEQEFCSIKKSLKRIIVGVDFNDNYLPSIRNLCPVIEIRKLSYWNCNFSLREI